MPYSNFTLEAVQKAFQLEIVQSERLHIDMSAYMLEQCDKILGILASMVAQKV